MVALRRAQSGARAADGPAQDWRWSSARAHLGLGWDELADLPAARERINDWAAFLAEGLDDRERDAIRAAEMSGRLVMQSMRNQDGDSYR